MSPQEKARRSSLGANREAHSESPDSVMSEGAGGATSPYWPVMLNVQGQRCVVVGGGAIALRRAKALVQHDAHVEVISPELCPELSRLVESGAVKATLREYTKGDLQGAFLVVAATDDGATNSLAAEEAMEGGVLVNVVDTPRLSSFIIPSSLRRGALTVAVSTGGASPALSRRIRTELEGSFGQEYEGLASLVEQVRCDLRERGINIPGEVWQRALDMDVLLEMLRLGQWDEAKRRLLDGLGRSE